MNPIILPGLNYDLAVSFPWEEGVVIRCAMQSKAGVIVERWEKPVSRDVWKKYGGYVGIAKIFLERIFQS